MMVPLRIHLILLFAIAFCGGLCSYRLANASEQSDALILYPNARDVRSEQQGGTDQLINHVDAVYPASGVIDWISEKLQSTGWQPLMYDFLNPGLPSSHSQGWTYFLHGLADPEVCVHQWLGDWKDASGNIVRYGFRYQHRGCDTSNLSDLEVVAIYIPADVARKTQQVFEQWKKEHELR